MGQGSSSLKLWMLPLAAGLACFAAGWSGRGAPERSASQAETPPAMKANPGAFFQERGSLRLAEWAGRLEAADDGSLPGLAAALMQDSSRRDLALWMPLLARWSEVDGTGMIGFVEREAPRALRPKLLEAAWYAWAAADPDAAIEAGGKLPPELIRSLLDGAAETDPRKAAAFARRSPDAQFAFRGIAERIVKADPDLADELLEGAVYDGGRYPFERAKISLLAASDPAGAIAYVQRVGVIGSDPVSYAVKAIAGHDPERAAQEVEAMPSSRSKALATVELAKTWAARDRDAAAAWARELPEGPVRHHALVAAAAASGYHDPEGALDLVMEAGRDGGGDFFAIKDGSVKPSESFFKPDADRTAGELLRRMEEANPGAAARYLEEKAPEDWRKDLAAAAGLNP